MTLYFFDENHEYFRSPGVPVPAPAALCLRIKVQCGKAAKVRVCMWPDNGEAVQTAMDFVGLDGYYEIYECRLEIEKAGLYWYLFKINTTYGSIVDVPENPGGSFQLTVHAPAAQTPDWIYGGVIYHIFVDRFHKAGEQRVRADAVYRPDWGGCPVFLPDKNGIVHNNDFFGGNLFGIIEKLPYLKKLGVTCLYLSPVFEAASNHKYDTGDYMKIDRSFGDNETFERLCSQAGEHGMKVILDGVFNHVGADSRYFNKYGNYKEPGAFQEEESPYDEWFGISEDGTYDSWWGIDLLPAVHKNSESYINFISGEDGVIAYWTKKGVSGWRLDVVDELPDVFLDPLCKRMKEENSEAYIVGEVWEDASNKIAYSVRRRYFLGGQLDSVTNYPLTNAIIACVKEGSVSQLADTMATLHRNYPPHILNGLMNVLGTHDTMRILTVLGGSDFPEGRPAMSKYRLTDQQFWLGKRKLRLASTLQFTLPGVPCVYYGDEAGMEGGADPFNRQCYPWGHEDENLVKWYGGLSQLRKTYPCFKDGKYELVEARNGLFAFTRGEGDGRLLIAVNMTDDDRVVFADGFNYNVLNKAKVSELSVRANQPAVFSIVRN